ncbi:Arabinose metabolism transcriptional repressor [Rubripirellula lacrimiformis]|uniref:Arabinose metabolism transcriptional repressor n=1 Tax=Rubripirellula lacrimiformis TaxID=1930273 RepID=A0A517NF35_9BACT|nr:GntR family transcriptional regulator [Rubripirellula lacrimiformis]QDT05741.1 Arabinose metabolism transcriptional repressor [Rubripirellula lacrimiformis]
MPEILPNVDMSEPKYKQIAKHLYDEIAAGAYHPSGRLPSESQLVQQFRVSRPTAARALRDLQDQGLIERRAGSGSYVRSGPAGKNGRQLGLLAPEIGSTEIFEVICGDLARLARVHDCGLIWGGRKSPDAAKDVEYENAEAICRHFVESNVSGVFFAPFEHIPNRDEKNQRLADRLHQAGISVILLDRDLVSFPQRSAYDLVEIDNFTAGYIVAEHLLKLGCERLLFLKPPSSAPTVTRRMAGALEAIRAAGCHSPPNFVCEQDVDDPKLMEALHPNHGVDGVICANDRVAATLLQSLAKTGIRVPHQLRLVGFDDVNYAALLSVPLTTMQQPCRQMAAVAFRAMLDSIEERDIPPRCYQLPARLVIRESCGAYLKANK